MTAESPPPSPPGWYPDPSGAPGQKYWDGRYWHAAVPARPGQQTGRKSSATRTWIIVGLIVSAVIIVVLVFALSPSPAERECKKAGILHGLQGTELEEMVKACVEVAKERGYQ
jgi:hypothetical protein